jgi:hypothetical protein
MTRMKGLVLPAALALLLAACGGGNEQPPVVVADPLSELPASASESASAMASYMSTLATLPADSREPVATDTFNPPRADDSEPEPIDS